MCNCGNKREGLSSQSFAGKENPGTPAQKLWPDVNFMYTGQSALSVTGSVSGKNYRFRWAGDRQLVDYRDASSMMKVPVLRKIS